MIHIDPRTGRINITYTDHRGYWRVRGHYRKQSVWTDLAVMTRKLLEEIR